MPWDSLFGLYAPELCHVVAGDVALSTGVHAPRLPPVAILVVENFQPLSFLEGEVLASSLVVVKKGDVNGSSRRRMVSAHRENRIITLPEADSHVCRVGNRRLLERVRVHRLRIRLAGPVNRIFAAAATVIAHGRLGE